MQRPIFIIGCSNESMNAAIVMASLDKPVTLVGERSAIDDVLNHYRFERQLVSLWDLYCKEQKIQVISHTQLVAEQVLANTEQQQATVWVFLDAIADTQAASLTTLINSPHQQVIFSGLTPIGDAQALAQQINSHWVFYFPLIFMKDGANFSSMLNPSLVLIGEKTPDSYQKSDVLLFFVQNADNRYVAAIKTVEFARTSIMAMLASRVSFMNEMSRLADSLQVNIHDVQAMMGLDARIGKDFLNAGWGFGGRALPQELTQLAEKFAQQQVSSPLIQAVIDVNEDQKELIFRKFWRHFDGFIEQKTVVIWGAGYRNGTGRTTHSAIHPLLKLLWSYDITTLVYATNTAFELSQLYGDNPLFKIVDDAYSPLQTADALFIINWSLPIKPSVERLNQVAIPIFDAKNVLNNSDKAKLIAKYYGVGR